MKLNKMNRLVSVLCAVSVLFSLSAGFTPAKAETANLLINGDFESTGANGLPTGWGLSGGVLSESFEVSTDDAQSGSHSVRFFGETTAIFISSTVSGIFEGEEYEFSGYLKRISVEGTTQININFQTPSGNTHADVSTAKKTFETKAGEWEKISFKSKVPQTATRAIILVRLNGGGECFFDNLSFFGKVDELTALSSKYIDIINRQKTESENEDGLTTYIPPFRDSKNILENSDFEKVAEDGKSIDGWASKKGWSNDSGWGYVEKENVHGGNTALKIIEYGSQNPYVSQIVDVVGGAQYQVSYYTKRVEGTATPTVKLEFYGDRSLAGATFVGQKNARRKEGQSVDDWTQIINTFTLPKNTRSLTVLVRLQGSEKSVAYFDDLQIYMTKAPDAFQLDTDWVFYYSDWDKGTISADANLQFFPELAKSSADISISDGETVLFEKKKVETVNGQLSTDFDLSLLAEKKKEYTVRAVMYDGEGNKVSEKTQSIFKYDRPKNLREDGVYLKNGTEPFYPVFAYHVAPSLYPDMVKAGINVVQTNLSKDIDTLKGYLDEAQKNGIMCLLTLYNGMKPAGNIDNIDFTIKAVSALKNHPALFAYAVMDEPFLGLADPEQDMWNSYRVLRDLDDSHPVYTVEATNAYYRAAAKCVDILGIDPYGRAAEKNASTATEKAMAAVDYKKPVYSLLQAFRNTDGHIPTSYEMRNTIYQALIAGASAIGYFSMNDTDKDQDGNKIPITKIPQLWDPVLLYGQKELKETYNHFVRGGSPYFNEGRGDEYWYSSWVKDGSIYMAVLGMKATGEVKASIPLTSFNGAVSLEGFTASVIAGAEEKSFTGSKSLDVTLNDTQTVLYKITPDSPVDFSGLGASSFDDLEDFPWARTEIAFLAEKGIVNKMSPWSYAPSEKITRGDFAYFLVRTLGLTADTAENFADVDSGAYYAKELAAGKALGILNGVGENKFNPEASISRQDLMTICARGMRYKNKLGEDGSDDDVKGFSDKEQIAGYAKSSVAAMVREGIVRGNTDGTINPGGNTTRAEAAVIMYRIYNK